jgi:hypothetical protein
LLNLIVGLHIVSSFPISDGRLAKKLPAMELTAHGPPR